jgi:hypothetical protein
MPKADTPAWLKGPLEFPERALALAFRIAGFILPRPATFAGAAVRVAASAFSFANLFKKAEHVRNTNSRERVLRVLANASEFRTQCCASHFARHAAPGGRNEMAPKPLAIARNWAEHERLARILLAGLSSARSAIAPF